MSKLPARAAFTLLALLIWPLLLVGAMCIVSMSIAQAIVESWR